MGEVLLLTAIVVSTLFGVLIYSLLGTIRAGLASCEPEMEKHLKAR